MYLLAQLQRFCPCFPMANALFQKLSPFRGQEAGPTTENRVVKKALLRRGWGGCVQPEVSAEGLKSRPKAPGHSKLRAQAGSGGHRVLQSEAGPRRLPGKRPQAQAKAVPEVEEGDPGTAPGIQTLLPTWHLLAGMRTGKEQWAQLGTVCRRERDENCSNLPAR